MSLESKKANQLARTGERSMPEKFDSVEEYLSYLRHLFAYETVIGMVPGNLRWLEIGSGEGYGTNLVSKTAENIIGLDIDQETIAHSNSKYGTSNCSFLHFEGNKLPLDSASFDIVISFQVIEHIEDDRTFVSEAHRMLKPGGRFILTTPNRTYRLRPDQKPWNRFHVREYYPEELRSVLNHSFSNVAVCGVRGKDDVQAIELAVVKKGFADIDRLNLRHLIPISIKPKLSQLARMITGRQLDHHNIEKAMAKYSTADYDFIDDKLETSLDLFGICVKE